MSIIRRAVGGALTVYVTKKVHKMIIDLEEGEGWREIKPGKGLIYSGPKRRKQKSNYNAYKNCVNKPKPDNRKSYVRPYVWVLLGAALLYSCQSYGAYNQDRIEQQNLVSAAADAAHHMATDFYINYCRRELKQEHLQPWEIDYRFPGCSMREPIHPLFRKKK